VTTVRIDVDGRPATADDLRHPALVNFGHFTSMQVRRGRVRGLELHLRRLTGATRELFDTDLDPDLVRVYVRRALADVAAASVRVNVFAPGTGTGAGAGTGTGDAVSVLVAIRPPVEPPAMPQRLLSVPYQRPVPHLKHVGGFGQIYYGRVAARQGYDDALLTDPSGTISETGVANIGFFDGTGVGWPDAPCLAGITMQLLVDGGLPGRRRPVSLADLPTFAGAFVANANGIAPVRGIDDLSLPVDDRLMRTVTERYDANPWELI
jgi:branched-subunit amino acid aminotransferase/4-amino-4-deoxychorismate lyase